MLYLNKSEGVPEGAWEEEPCKPQQVVLTDVEGVVEKFDMVRDKVRLNFL